jgi:hypothetical protein
MKEAMNRSGECSRRIGYNQSLFPSSSLFRNALPNQIKLRCFRGAGAAAEIGPSQPELGMKSSVFAAVYAEAAG